LETWKEPNWGLNPPRVVEFNKRGFPGLRFLLKITPFNLSKSLDFGYSYELLIKKS